MVPSTLISKNQAGRFIVFLITLSSTYSLLYSNPLPIRITENVDASLWVLGANKPILEYGVRSDGTTGAYHYLLVGTNPYYCMSSQSGQGSVEFWINDPGKCMQDTNPGYSNRGPQWGLITPFYQAMCVGISREYYVSGCLGYSPWSTVSPYTPYWFKDGIRGANGVPWTAGWYKWRVDGRIDNITFTLYNVAYCITDGPPDDDITTGDCIQTYDATFAGGIWASLFGNGWNGIQFQGDNLNGVEDIRIDEFYSDGVFVSFNEVDVSRPYHQSSWGNIKVLFSPVFTQKKP